MASEKQKAERAEEVDEAEAQPRPKRCFVISAFGKTPEDQRMHAQVLKHLIRKVLSPRGYDVKRADELADEGLITNQIIERLLDDELVVADLTGLNPNVFYEMAVRHAVRKPIIHLITKGISIPFDVANMRAVQYVLTDPDQLEAAQAELEEKVKSIEDSGFEAAPNPITAARDVVVLRESEKPEARDAGELLHAFAQVQDEVRRLSRRVEAKGPTYFASPATGSSYLGESIPNAYAGEGVPNDLTTNWVSLIGSDDETQATGARQWVVDRLTANGAQSIGELISATPFANKALQRALAALLSSGVIFEHKNRYALA